LAILLLSHAFCNDEARPAPRHDFAVIFFKAVFMVQILSLSLASKKAAPERIGRAWGLLESRHHHKRIAR
jgi:hypothetical protein